MRTTVPRSLLVLTLCAAVGLSGACGERARGGESAVAITDIELGRTIEADGTIGDHSNSFRPMDVVYVSVGTKGQGEGTLRARWLRGTEEIAADTRTVSGPRRTEFRLSRPNGLPTGEYRVEITLNGVAAGHENFTVN